MPSSGRFVRRDTFVIIYVTELSKTKEKRIVIDRRQSDKLVLVISIIVE